MAGRVELLERQKAYLGLKALEMQSVMQAMQSRLQAYETAAAECKCPSCGSLTGRSAPSLLPVYPVSVRFNPASVRRTAATKPP